MSAAAAVAALRESFRQQSPVFETGYFAHCRNRKVGPRISRVLSQQVFSIRNRGGIAAKAEHIPQCRRKKQGSYFSFFKAQPRLFSFGTQRGVHGFFEECHPRWPLMRPSTNPSLPLSFCRSVIKLSLTGIPKQANQHWGWASIKLRKFVRLRPEPGRSRARKRTQSPSEELVRIPSSYLQLKLVWNPQIVEPTTDSVHLIVRIIH